MAQDDDWGDVESVPTKSQVPKLLFCGLGCFLPLLFMIVVFTWIGSSIQRGRDTGRQWAELQVRLPHDERPEGWRLLFGFQPGGISWLLTEEVFVFSDAPADKDIGEGRTILLIWTDDDLGEMFDTSREGISPYRVTPPPPDEPAEEGPDAPSEGEGDAGPSEPVAEPELVETIDVQGRACPIVLLEGDAGGGNWFSFGQGDAKDAGPAVAVLLSPTGATRKLLLIAQTNEPEPMDLETLQEFLGAFDVGAASDLGSPAEGGGEGR